MKKIIYITSRFENNKSFVNTSYYNLFINTDFICVPLPFINNKDKLYQLLKSCSGIIISGGIDINPNRYKEKCINSNFNDILDDYDFLILDLASKLKLPILGICRGLQLINVYFEGSLCQHIENHSNTLHPITIINKHPFLLNNKKRVMIVNSFHHQAIKDLGKDLVVCAISDDNIIEAIYSTSLPIFAVQWHPELLEDTSIINAFFDLCNLYYINNY